MWGLLLFLRYVEKAGLYALVPGKLSFFIPQSSKGLQLQEFIKQILAFFMDWTELSIAGFDQKKKDEG